jgi:hypothetical protein
MDSLRALEVVRTKRAKQQMQQQQPPPPPEQPHHYTSNSRLKYSSAVHSPSPTQLPLPPPMTGKVDARVVQPPSKAPSPLPPLPPPPLLSPESMLILPPPPSPPCTCGKVLTDMGPPPPNSWDDVDEVDHMSGGRSGRRASLDSCFTTATTTGSESQRGGGGSIGATLDHSGRRSQGYPSSLLGSAANSTTYLIDATGADPILLPAHELYNSYPGAAEASAAATMTPLSGGGGKGGNVTNSSAFRQQQQNLIQRLDNGFGPNDLFDVPLPMSGERSSGYTSLGHEDRLGSGGGGGGDKLRSNGKANGRAAVGILPALGRPLMSGGGGQCNHLADGCECFRENGFPHLSRKVRKRRTGYQTSIKNRLTVFNGGRMLK